MSLDRWLDRAIAVRDCCSLCWNDPYLLYRLRRYRRHLTDRVVRVYNVAVRYVPTVPTYHDMAEATLRARAQERRNAAVISAYDYKRLHAMWLEGRTNIPVTKTKTEESS